MTPRILGAPVVVGANHDEVVCATADAVDGLLSQALIASLVVSGGASTPAVLHLVAKRWRASHLPNIIVSDERHSEDPTIRNADQLRAAVSGTSLADAPIIAPPSGGDLIAAAHEWSRRLEHIAPPSLAIVSMAYDGHVASLFPNVEATPVSTSVVVCQTSPKPPPQRISLSGDYLREIQHRFAVVIGANKLAVLTKVTNGNDLPVVRLTPTSWFVESTAMPD